MSESGQSSRKAFDANQPSLSVDQFEAFYDRYFGELMAIARNRLREYAFRAWDSEDVAQSAFFSLIRGLGDGRFRMESNGQLRSLMQRVLIFKCNRYVERYCAKKRGGGKVRGDSYFNQIGQEFGESGFGQVADPNKSPELADQVVRDCTELLEQLKKPELQCAAILRLEGCTHEEIAQQMSCSVPTVKKRLKEIRELWRNELEE